MTILGVAKEEFEYYLDEFKKARYFAAIKAGGECLNSDLAKSLTILHGFGLLPVLVHGGGKQIDNALEERGIVSKKIDGKRITDKETLDVVVSTLKTVNENFVSEINNYAKGFNCVFYVDGIDPVYRYVGNVIDINKSAIDKCLDEKLIPVISSLAVDNQGGYFNPNADSAYMFLVSKLKPMKVIFLTSIDGVYKGEELVSEINSRELQKFIDSPFITGGMKLKLKEAKSLVDLGYDVQITNPKNLLKELFSKKGHGTYIQK